MKKAVTFPSMFEVGKVYRTLEGFDIEIVEENAAETDYATVKGHDGIYRYNSRDFGRTTATCSEVPYPKNLEIPVDKRHMIKFLGLKSSLLRAKNCGVCTSRNLLGMRDPTNLHKVAVRCNACGNKSLFKSNLHNAVNLWNEEEYQ